MRIWDALLLIRQQFESTDHFPLEISIGLEPETSVSFESNSHADVRLLFPDEVIDIENPLYEPFRSLQIDDQVGLNKEEMTCLSFYLPYTTLGFFGRKLKKCFTISHFAQTLDGRIATSTGDSKWIGNEENLLHAHRMRALCGGILVGAETIRRDNPQLNVRKVKGLDPVKVVIGGNGELDPDEYHAIGPNTLMYKDQTKHHFPEENVLVCDSEELEMSQLLAHLCDRGIFSVYIEGGSLTTSTFIRQDQLDQIQLHFAPKILGAGVQSFVFGGVDQIQDAVTFKNSQFLAMGDEMMFIGNL